MNRLQRDLKRKERELKEIEEVSATWLAELRAKISQALELGLITNVPQGELTNEQMILLLEGIVHQTDLTLEVNLNTISDAVRELTELEKEESQISQFLTGLRRRLIEMNRVRESASGYQESLHIQRDRLQIADWLIQHQEGDEHCPICGGNFDSTTDELKELHKSLLELEQDTGENYEVPAAFERELQRVETEVNQTAERLKAIQIRKRALSERSTEAHSVQFKAQKAERFVGNLENALQLYRRLGQNAEVKVEVETLRERVQQLQSEMRSAKIEERKRRALSIVNSNAGRLLPALDTERPDAPISLEINDLTIQVIGPDRNDYLSEIGSGSNWLSYHIAMMLGLQEFFLSLEHTPVPNFLILDQPSQVYFPKRVTIRADESPEEPEWTRDEDIEAVRKAFTVMGNVVGRSNGRLQVIVLDHAPPSVWGSLPNIVEVEDWREGKKLVPPEWFI